MPGPFEEVKAEDFSKLTIDPLPHQAIERAIIAIGGGGVAGMQFKNEILVKAGWSTDRLRSYASRADQAAQAFNRVRVILEDTEDRDELLSRLSA